MDITERNIERLLTVVYKPEEIDPEFAQSVEDYLCGMARDLADQRSAQTSAPRPAATVDQLRYRTLRRRLGWAMGVAACLAIVALVVYAQNRPRTTTTDFGASPPNAGAGITPVFPRLEKALLPKARPTEVMPKLAAVNTRLVTKANERRRVALTDGSTLYLNQNSDVTLSGPRQLILSKGEVYVEVAPSSDSEGATFVIKTPTREVSALGTHFAVKTAPAGTGVVVTQGKVKVSGLEQVITAGQEVKPGTAEVSAAPRASHVLDWLKPLIAAGEAPLVPPSKYAGGALIAVDPFGQEMQLTLRKYHVDVHIEDGFARTTIDQTYFNNDWNRLEGTFYFPLPADAVLSRLAMYVEDQGECKLMEGGMAERDHARNVFETIRYTQRDPALLEWVDGTTFKMRVFPLEGRKEKRIILSYTQRLGSLYGSTRYRFPGGHNMPAVRDWSFRALVRGGARLDIAAEPHMQAAPEAGDAVLTAQAHNIAPNQDIMLELSEKGTQLFSEKVRFSSASQDGSEYLMVRFRPELKSNARRQRRDWVILFESAANRSPLLARTQIDVIRYLLRNTEHDDTFVLLTAGTRVRLLDKNIRTATPDNIAAAVKFLESTHLIGGLDLEKALQAAEPFLKNSKNPHLLHVGAGICVLGERRDDVLARRIPEEARYIGISVGKQWNRSFMRIAAERTGGYFRQINPDESVAWHAFDLLATLNTPRLMGLRVVDNAEKAAFLTDRTASAQGEEACAIARVEQARNVKTVTVAGSLEGKPFQRVLDVTDIEANAGYLPRAWAKLEIDRLIADGAEKNKAKIVELSKASYVMSPFTSLLVLETDADYQRFNVDRGRKDHWAMYISPARIPIVYEPDPNRGNVPVKNEAKRSVPEVLQTVQVRIPPRFLYRPSDGQQSGQVTTNAWLVYTGVYAAPLQDALSYLGDIEIADSERGGRNVDPGTGIFRFGDRVGVPGFVDGTSNATTMFPTTFTRNGGLMAAPMGRPGPAMIGSGGGSGRMAGGMAQPMGGWAMNGGMMGMAGGFGGMMGMGGGLGGGGARGLGGFGSGGFGMRSGFGGFNGVMMGGSSTAPNFFWPGPVNEVAQRVRFAPVWFGAHVQGWGPGQTPIWAMPRDESRPVVPGQMMTLGEDRNSFKEATRLMRRGLTGKSSPYMNLTWQEARIAELQLLVDEVDNKKSDKTDPEGTIGMPFLGSLLAGAWQAFNQPSLLYERSMFTGDNHFFTDLTLYAPGLSTNARDLQAVLEDEVKPAASVAAGAIDPAARTLIDKARAAGWQSLTIPGKRKRPDFKIVFNGAGQFTYERVLWSGLREIVVNDSKTLLHLYPEIGLGARRQVSRLHRSELARLVPWSLPPAEELARGADLRAVDKRVVAIIPKASGAEQVHLVFADDGRLQERRLVEMPARRILYREVYGVDGAVAWFNGKDTKPIAERKQKLAAAPAPNMKPDTDELVLLPIPWRTPNVFSSKLAHLNNNYSDLDADTAIAFMAANIWQNTGLALQIFGERFHAKGDRRLGFYTLIAAAGMSFHPQISYQWNQTRVTLDIEAEHPTNPLGKYLAKVIASPATGDFGKLGGPVAGFIQQLAAFHDSWRQVQTSPRGEHDKVNAFLKECTVPEFAWAAASLAIGRGANDVPSLLADHFPHKSAAPGLEYAARYEYARTLFHEGQADKARQAFEKLYRDTRVAGVLPLIDQAFRQALTSGSGGSFAKLARETSARLLKEHRDVAALAQAIQVRQLGDAALADELLNAILDRTGQKRPAITLAAIQHLSQSGQAPRADALLQELLKDEKLAQQPVLWRFAAQVAQQRGLVGRAAAALEKALDLEYPQLPALVNLQHVRSDYGTLLNQYHQLVLAINAVESAPPKKLVAKVVLAADRWRALDPDATQACQLAAKTLQLLGQTDLAWEYLTTPVALQPNEASPWLNLAHHLQTEDVELADRAFDLAFQAEPTNAQILWERAQHLQQFGRRTQAQELYRRLAEGNWQPRFEGHKQQARQQLMGSGW